MTQTDRPIMVSVICNTYNHEAYIRSALDGFVMQKTNFAFEILVHDDASTDHTADIVREYEKKYPELIKPIYQTENQWSKDIAITRDIQIPRAKGSYIAMCEGDDYWTDPYKLQRQFDAMQAHPEVDICAHDAVWMRDGKQIGHTNRSGTDTIFPAKAVIAGGGGFVDTASLFFKRDILVRYQAFFEKAMFCDYSMQVAGALRGGMLYLANCMSVTRLATPGSWTVEVSRTSYYLLILDYMDELLDVLDETTAGAYSRAIGQQKQMVQFERLERNGNYRQLRQGQMRELYRKKPLKWKILTYVKQYAPAVYVCYQRVCRR